ncbi:MAG TPA: N-acetylmuramoyl-L-alanine amidase [Myxococcales bacterium]
MAIMVIDPGHGGTRAAGSSSPVGVVGPEGLREKDVTLLLARRLLGRLGGGTFLTRSKDENVSLGQRAAVARKARADLFLSIHANSGPAGSRGAEVWLHDGAGPRSAALAQRLAQQLGRLEGGARVLRGPLAVLSPDHHAHDTAACLVEVDYLSSRDAERRLRDPKVLDAIAAALAAGVRGAFGRGGTARALDAPRYPEPPEELKDKLREWTKRVIEGGKTIGTVAEILSYWTAEASSFSAAAVEVPAIAATILEFLGPIGAILGVIIVIGETIRAFGTGLRRQYQRGYCYGLMWRSLDMDSQIPNFIDWLDDSAEELRASFVKGVEDGRMRALDVPVRNQILLLVALETAKGVVSPSLAPQPVLQQLWYKIREHVPGDSEHEWPIGWPRPDDMHPLGGD